MDLSVIIPCYNSSSTIVESMDSVVCECAANDYTWELIIVDDGSKDNSAAIIDNYIATSPHAEHIKLIKQPNGGAAVARNTGINATQGEFIAFNDSDDKWLPGKLKSQMEYLKKSPDVVLVSGIFGEDNMSQLKKLHHYNIITINDQILKNYFSPQAVLLCRSILSKSGLFNPKMRHAEEGYFFNNIVYNGKSVLINQHVTAPISPKERWGDSGLSGNLLKMEQGELFNIKSAYKLRYITFSRYLFAVCFSLAKFVRRWIISKYRKLCK